MTSPSFSGEGTALTAIRAFLLKFCKTAPQGDWVLSQKSAVQSVRESEPLLTLPCNMVLLSGAEDPAFQKEFMGEEGSQHPVLTLNPFSKHPEMDGGGGGEAGRGVSRSGGKKVLG